MNFVHFRPFSSIFQPQNIIRLLDASYVDGTIYCKIMREPRSTVMGNSFDLINNKYHLLVASGSSLKRKPCVQSFRLEPSIFDWFSIRKQCSLTLDKFPISGLATENSVGYHDLGRVASAAPSYLADVATLGGSSKLFLRLHAAFMLIAWIGTASVGILLARYYKQTWVGSQLCGKDQWFAVSATAELEPKLRPTGQIRPF